MRALAITLMLAPFVGLSSCRTDAAPGDKPPPAPTAASRSGSKASKLPRGQVRFDTPRGVWMIDVEIARTAEDRAQGLMFRADLPPDSGMLFVFEETMEHGFWMHNTLLSLDLIFLDDTRATVGVVAHAQPQTDTPRTVKQPSRYVVEVLAGEAAAHAVGPGVRAAFVGIDE